MSKTYDAHKGGGATLNGAQIRASFQNSLTDADVLTARANLKPEHWAGDPPPIKASFRSSLAYRMCLVAEGRFDAMLTFRGAWEWDVAAGTLIIEEAAGLVTGGLGEALVYNNPEPKLPGIIAGGPDIHAALLARRPGIG